MKLQELFEKAEYAPKWGSVYDFRDLSQKHLVVSAILDDQERPLPIVITDVPWLSGKQFNDLLARSFSEEAQEWHSQAVALAPMRMSSGHLKRTILQAKMETNEKLEYRTMPWNEYVKMEMQEYEQYHSDDFS